MEATSCKVHKESRKTKVDVQTGIRPALSQWEFSHAIETYYHFCACLRISSSIHRYTMWKSLSSWSRKENRGFTMWRFDKNFRLQMEEFIYHLMSAYDDLIYVCAQGHKKNTKKTSLKQAPMKGQIQREWRGNFWNISVTHLLDAHCSWRPSRTCHSWSFFRQLLQQVVQDDLADPTSSRADTSQAGHTQILPHPIPPNSQHRLKSVAKSNNSWVNSSWFNRTEMATSESPPSNWWLRHFPILKPLQNVGLPPPKRPTQ